MKSKSFFYENRESFTTIHDCILRSYQKYPDIEFCKYLKDGAVQSKTYSDMYIAATAIGRCIKENTQGKGHAALLGNSSFEWFSAYFGMMYYGVVAVPVDRQLSREELLSQVDNADVEVLLYDNKFKDIADYIKEKSQGCRRFICFDKNDDDEYFWDIVENNNGPVDESAIQIDPKQLAEIVYTSGTTGTSKGVMLSHENLASNVEFAISIVDFKPGDTILSIMPNHHTYELTCAIMTPMCLGMTIAINDTIAHLLNNFKLFKPHVVLVVPALLKIVQKEIVTKIKKQNKEFKFIMGINLKKLAGILHIDISKKLFSEIHEVFGGRLHQIICGGSYLKEELITFYDNIGINIVQGYGITECSPLISCNTDRNKKSRTVGKVCPRYKVRTVDGELQVSGSNVMMGYYKNPKLTAEVMDGEWYKTGDLGLVDSENFIKLVGRKKNLIILSNGENVSPEELENLLDDIDIIDTAMVYEKDDQIAVEVYAKEAYVKEHNITDVKQEVRSEIYKLNATLPVFKQIRSMSIRSEPFEKTTTLKIKRDKIKNPTSSQSVKV
jgi:long-chain acyl-CoA synthetase